MRREKNRSAEHAATPRGTSYGRTQADPSRNRAVRQEVESLIKDLMSTHHSRNPEA